MWLATPLVRWVRRVIYSMPKASISSERLCVFPFSFYVSLFNSPNSNQIPVKQIWNCKTAFLPASPLFSHNCLTWTIWYRKGKAASSDCFLCAALRYLSCCHRNHSFHSTYSTLLGKWLVIIKETRFLPSHTDQPVTITLVILLIRYILFPHLSCSFFVGCELFDMGTKAMWEFTKS